MTQYEHPRGGDARDDDARPAGATPALFAAPPATGPDLDRLDERLAALTGRPVADHLALYSDLHAELTAKLQATDR